MRRLDRRWHWAGIFGGGLLVAGAAWASPWDIDMIDGYNFKAFEWAMRQPPEGVVPRESLAAPRPGASGLYQNAKIDQFDRTTDAGKALTNPYTVDEAHVATGKRMFQVYCQPCHGPDGKGGGTVTHNDAAAGIRRFPVPAPLLSGPGAVSAQRTDGYLYLTIRNGGSVMPSYGLSLTDHERWSIVSYIRTLDGAQAPVTAVPAEPAPVGGTPG